MTALTKERVPNIIVHPVQAVVNDKTMEENCISREIPEYAEDYQVEYVDGLHIVVLGSISIGLHDYHVIEVEPDHNGDEQIYILSLVRAE